MKNVFEEPSVESVLLSDVVVFGGDIPEIGGDVVSNPFPVPGKP